jgi:hypothetical protein
MAITKERETNERDADEFVAMVGHKAFQRILQLLKRTLECPINQHKSFPCILFLIFRAHHYLNLNVAIGQANLAEIIYGVELPKNMMHHVSVTNNQSL